VEDLVSTGKSSLSAVEALEEAGAKIKGMVAIFTYGFQIAEDNFAKANCRLSTLTDYNTLIKQALKLDYITDEQVETLQDWRNEPSKWQPALIDK
jgi:orotate phosphoribosyltransferase